MPNPTDDELRDLLTRYRRVAVVGLSNRPERPSNGVAAYLLRAGYAVVPVNPNVDAALGLPAVASLRDVPPPVEIVNVFRRPSEVPPVVDDAIAAGAKVVWLQLGIAHAAAAARARTAGLVVVQDRCIAVDHRRLGVPAHA